MARPIEDPVTISEGPEWKHETVTRHPSYGQIGASRVSGGAMLYGSDFQHQNYIAIRISRSELHRSLSNDWPFARDELIEVALSEAQWATFVSSMNVGSGVQCTLQHINREMIPGLPAPESRKDQFAQEAQRACDEGMKRLETLKQLLAASKLSQKAKDDLIKVANSVGNAFVSSTPFIMEQFGEHMEHTTEKAKIEINAYATNLLMRTGLQALQGEVPLSLPEEKTDDNTP